MATPTQSTSVETPAASGAGTIVQTASVSSETPTPVPTPTNPVTTAQIQQTMATSIVQRLSRAMSFGEWTTLLADMKIHGTNTQKYLIDFLGQYVVKMAPGKRVASDEGVNMQRGLWSHILVLLNDCPSDEFVSGWMTLLRYAYYYRDGAFADTHVFRFQDDRSWNQTDLTTFSRLLSVITRTSDPTKLKNTLKTIDFTRLPIDSLSPLGHQRITAFYNR